MIQQASDRQQHGEVEDQHAKYPWEISIVCKICGRTWSTKSAIYLHRHKNYSRL